MRKTSPHIFIALMVVVLAMQGCGTKKNTATSRFWQAFTTRYNVYYHGKTNYDEQLQEMLANYEDDYSQHVFIHPAEARNYPKSPQPTGSFDRTIEKMQKAIATHSIKKKPKKKAGKSADPKYKEWMKRDEYNPFLHNAWFTMAQAQYMKGDFLNAAATFRYISRHFLWKPDLVTESQVWEALSYCALGWTTEADNVLAHVHVDKIGNKRIRSLANLAWADYYIKEHRNEQAIPYLAQAVKGAKGGQKVRLNFLLGQLYEDAGKYDLAYRAYKRAGSSSGSTYRTKLNARIKQSAVYRGANIMSEVRALKRMTRYDRNKPYLDQIYYAIGNLYLSRGDTTHAVENYVKAAEKSTRNGIDKAISQLTLGGVYFAQHKYDKAQPCYAEAIPQLNEEYPNYKFLKQRSDVLDELAVYSGNVTLQDSLLKLSKMTPEEQKKVIKKIIDELKKKEKEEKDNAARENYLAQQDAKGNALGTKGNTPAAYQINSDNSWYFYNSATVNAGKTAFQQRWGNRKLEDNWRRRNKATFSLGEDTDILADNDAPTDTTAAPADTTQVDKQAQQRENDPHYEEYYLKQIPKTEEQIQAAHDVIQEGLYNMGVILKDKLDDLEASADEFNELLRRYPDNTYRLDVYYNMYLLYMRANDPATAERYRGYILTDFAESKYGIAMQDPLYLENLKNMPYEEQLLYEQAYDDYLNNDNDAVHAAYDLMMEKYPLSKIMPKFMFIDALSYVTERDYDGFKNTLKDMLQRYPETDITPIASSIVKQLNQGRKLEGGGSNARGMIWSIRLSNDTLPQDLDKKFTPFQEDSDKPQVFILLYPTDSVSSNMLLYEVARHNFNSFVVKDYDLEQMNFGRLGLLVVKGFANFDEVKHYRTVFEQDETLVIPPQVHIVLISESNFALLLNEGRTFEDYFNYLEEQNNKKHAKLEGSEAKDRDEDAEEAADGALPADSLALDNDTIVLSDTTTMADSAALARRAAVDAKKAEAKAKREAEKAKKDEEAKRKADEKARQAEQKRKADEERRAEIKRQRAEAARRKADEARRKAELERETANTGGGGTITEDEPDTAGGNNRTSGRTLTDNGRRADNAVMADATAAPGVARSVRDSKQETDNQKANDKKAREQARAEQKRQEREAKLREKAENEHLKQLEREAKEQEKAEQKRYKAQQDSIKKVEKAQNKALRLAELAREDSIEQAMLDHERMMDNARKSREDSVKNLRKQKEQALKQAKKEKEQARKQREKERKEQLKQKERERKAKAEERRRKQKEREQERKAKQKAKAEEQKAKRKAAEQRQKEKQDEAKARANERKSQSKAKNNADKDNSGNKNTTKRGEAMNKGTAGTEAARSVRDKKN